MEVSFNMKKYIVSSFLVLASALSASVSAVSLDVSAYDQFVSSASASNAEPFGQIGAANMAAAITDVDTSTFIYVPSASTSTSLNVSLGFSAAVDNQAGTDLSFFFVGGGTSNSIDLSINGVTRVYGSSEVVYTDASQTGFYTAVTNIGTYALSGIFVDLNDFGVNSFTNMDITLGKGTYLSLVAANAPPAPVSAVPVPAAVWLFASGLLAMAGVARRKV